MKLYKLDLLTLLISLFILSACENPDSIGLDVDPSDAITGNLIDTVSIRSFTVKEDSIITNSMSDFPIGNLDDPIFGPTTSSIAASLNLPTSPLTFGTTPVLDSAVLVLKYSDEYFGDPNALHKFEVYTLTDRLTSSSNFLNTALHTYNPDIIGSKTSKVNIKDSVEITEIVTGKPDIKKKQAPQLRIPISSSYISDNFLNGNPESFKDNTVFNNFVKGLYLTVNKSATAGVGGIAFLDLGTNGSKLELYYKSKNGTATDTTVTSFAIQNSAGPIAGTFVHDYRGTEVQTQLNNPLTSYNYNFIQPMAGVKTKLNFPFITKLKELGNIVVNKAELVVTVEGNFGIFEPAPRLFLYSTDIAEQRVLIPDVSDRDARALSDTDFGGFYNSSLKRYKFVVTAYVQDLINGKLKQYDTYIAAVDNNSTRLNGIFPAGSTAARVVIGSGQSSTPNKMKLNILYTKVN
ncbi:DUF4270 domain-containing protein [Daejeonella oryzae]|uniref:DUF4270 domain-containing protein n=1 Tax=Daejeonella oryzae TaxID=1122943 RepID=UPI0009DB7E69|nr:DUF4270 domain-containing protein [Daejeonella oryzae]